MNGSTDNNNNKVDKHKVYTIETELKNLKRNEENKLQQEKINEDQEVDEEDYDDLESGENLFGKAIIRGRTFLIEQLKRPIIKWIVLAAAIILYPIYFGFSMKLNPPFSFPANVSQSIIIREYVFKNNIGLALFVLTMFSLLMIAWELGKKNSSRIKWRPRIRLPKALSRFLSRFGTWIVILIVTLLCIAYLAYDLKDPYNLISLLGLFVFIFLCILMSKHPSRINYRALVVGILIQYILGVFILRVEFGYELFKFLGNRVSTFLDFTDNGSSLVFGTSFMDHFFAFKAMPVIIFFSVCVNILYHFGMIQFFLLKLAWIINFLMGTSPTESVNNVANVFLGPTEAPLLIKPLLPKMTQSELFALMTAGFSTVSGSVLAAYIGFGVPADHLITAGLMSAPASLAIAKTIFPETKKTKADWEAIKNVKSKKFSNVFDAISSGAMDMIRPIASIIANVIAFVALFSFLDAVCIWFFSMINLTNFGLASIIEYLFWPFAFLMGVNSVDCLAVAKLVGYKIFVNEFVAFGKLGTIINLRNDLIANGTYPLYQNGTLTVPPNIGMIWNDRSIMIATYALCGFANFGTVGIEVAVLSVFAPSRSKVFTKYAIVAMIAGNFSSFMNACIAGLLYKKI